MTQDEQEVAALRRDVTAAIDLVIAHHTSACLADLSATLERLACTHDEAPRFARWLLLSATHELLTKQMLAAITAEGERAQRLCAELIDRLGLVIAPTSSAPH